jgi:DNA-binding MarR family transcriptional regulator
MRNLSAMMLTLLGDPDAEPMALTAMADRMGLSRSEASRVGSRLMQRRLVTRTRSPVDKRISLYSLTVAGRAELARLTAAETEQAA